MQHYRSFTFWVAASLLAGCVVTPATRPDGGAGSGDAVTKAPTARASSGAASAPKAKPPKPPARVNLPVPKVLTMVAAGSGNLVGNDGSSLVGNDGSSLVGHDGSSLVGNDGSSLIAAGGGNLGTTSKFGLLQTAPCPQTGGAPFLTIVSLLNSVYLLLPLAVNPCLDAVIARSPDAGEPFTFKSQGLTLTGVLTSPGGVGGLLRVSIGDTFDPAKLMVSMTYENNMQGHVVYRYPGEHPKLGKLALTSDFDLMRGTVDAEGATAGAPLMAQAAGAPRIRAHLRFRTPPAALPAGVTFQVAASAAMFVAGAPCESDRRGVVMAFDAGGRAAARMGRVFRGTDEGALTFSRADRTGYDAAPAPTSAFFLGTDAKEVPVAETDAAFQAMVPTAEQFYRPFPAELGDADPLADPAFTFPATP